MDSIPAEVLSFRLMWVGITFFGKLSSSTANPWFWLVISMVLFPIFLTGWFIPRWPNFSLKVFAPNAIAKIWWPKQIPNIGFFPSICFTVSIPYLTAAGSPGPFDKNTPSGSNDKISFAVAIAGKTVTWQFNSSSNLRIFFLIPKSMAATLYSP